MTTIKNWLTGPRIVLFALIISALSHLPFINLGPRSVHVWRQCNTLAVARNFYQEDMDILNPRVDRRLDTDGVTGMQFPSYEYIVALGYKAFGIHNWVHRLLSLIITFWGAVGMFYLSKLLLKHDIAAGFTALAYTFSPDLYYFGFSALPDILALACSVWGLYYFIKWFAPPSHIPITNTSHQSLVTNFILSLLLITIAGLTKLQFLAIGFFIAPYILLNIDVAKKKVISLIVFGITACAIPLLWYRRSVELIETSGLADFGITFRPENNWEKGINTIIQNITSDLPDLLLNYSSFLIFLFSIFFFFKNKFWKSKWFIPMLVWTLSLIAYHIIELAQMNVHSYYMMPYLPVLFLMIGYGVKHIGFKSYGHKLIVVLMILSPVLTSFRIIPSRFTKSNPGIPIELYNNESRNILINSAPQDALCIVGPDISGCIYFYHIEKKGFGFDNINELEKQVGNSTLLVNYIQRGARYLYTNDTSSINNTLINTYFEEINRVGDFCVFKLKKQF